MQGCFFPFPYGSRFSLASPLARVLGHHPSSLLCFPTPTPVSVRLPPHCQGGSYPVPKPIWEFFQVQAAQVRTHSMAVADLGCRDGLGSYRHMGHAIQSIPTYGACINPVSLPKAGFGMRRSLRSFPTQITL